MGCCGQNPVGAGAVAVDTCKRVNYTLGMLLGVDDFVQESAYNIARRRQLARELLGYGTARGLEVVVESDGDRGPRLRVSPGLALLPSGTPVCVDVEQCCNLNDWLAARAALVSQALAAGSSIESSILSPPANIVLHLVLSYAQCLTDQVAIPGEPCRSEDELMQASRVADGFTLELRLTAPAQREEDAIRDFVDWLTSIPVVGGSPPVDEQTFIDQVRAAARAWLEPDAPTSPPTVPGDFMSGAPGGALRANDTLLRAALRLWTTELRPLWMARVDCGCDAAPAAAADDVLLLATIDVPLVATGGGSDWRVSDAPAARIGVDADRRPLLQSLRMVQELITQNPTPEAGDSVSAADAFGLPPDAGSDAAYSRADHHHGTPELPPLAGDLDGRLDDNPPTSPPQAPRVVGLRGRPLADAVPGNGQALLFGAGGWAPGAVVRSLPALNGDLDGELGGERRISTSPLPRVVGLQGRAVAATAPGDGQALLFGADGWAPGPVVRSLPALNGDLDGELGGERQLSAAPLPRVVGLQGRAVAATEPGNGQALVFNAGQWAPATIDTAAGDFVGRSAGVYEIVAAGEIAIELDNGEFLPSIVSSYGGLKPTDGGKADAIERVRIGLTASVPGAEKIPLYIVKLTALWGEGSSVEFRLYLLDTVKASGNTIDFSVLLSADRQISDGNFRFRFQVEVSRFRDENSRTDRGSPR